VSCREDDYHGALALGLEELTIEPLTPERVRAVIYKWAEAYGQSTTSVDALLSLLDPNDQTLPEEDGRSLMKLASNPFMLSMIYFVWAKDGATFRNRAELFSRFVSALMIREGVLENDRATPLGQMLLAGLQDLAWRLQYGESDVWGRRRLTQALTSLPAKDS